MLGARDRASHRLVRLIVERDKSVAESLAWIAGLLSAPTALRAMVDAGTLGLPFVTYWPSLLIASVALRLRYAATFAFTAAVLSQRLFGGGTWFTDLTAVRLVLFGLFGISATLIVLMGMYLRRLVRTLAEVNAQQATFNRELRHRVRNMLALIQTLAARGPKAASPLDFYKEFSQRLEGLAAASDLLQIGADAEGRLPLLVRQTIAPFDRDGRIHLAGEPCVLPTDSCIPLIMALHELCTNAIKHGALSNDAGAGETGKVDLTWFIGPDGHTLYLLWAEKNGPRVVEPTRFGLGTKLLRPQPGLDSVELCFAPAGVWCEIRLTDASSLPR